MENFIISSGYSSNPVFNQYQGFYSPITQALANQFPSWTDIRNHASDPGQQFLNATAFNIQNIQRNYASVQDSFFVQTVDLNQADVLYTVQLPVGSNLQQSSIPYVTGDGNVLTPISDINTFLYQTLPTRISLNSIQQTTSINFIDELPYDINWTDPQNYTHTLYYNASTGRLQKYYYIDQLPLEANPPTNDKEIIGTYVLQDINGNTITGTYQGATLYLDWLYVLFNNVLYLFDARIPIQQNTDVGFVPNQEVTSIQALAQVTLIDGLTGSNNKIAFDITNRFIWIQNGANYFYYQLYFDYVTIDYINSVVYCREQYNIVDVTINNITTSYSPTIFNLWNALDEFGLELNTPRLLGERNPTYQKRLLDVCKFRSNSTAQGLVNSITLNLGLSGFYGYLPSGTYPSGLYPNGNYVSGYPYYISGVYPTGIYNIAKINALFDPSFYNTVVPTGTNIPSSSFCGYTREILQTFPILWGSGLNDPYGFTWDLTPFDGGLNYTNIIPNFFANAYNGVSGIYFQSGVGDPSSDQLKASLVQISGNIWQPRINDGTFYINAEQFFLYAQPNHEEIPSGVLTYNIINSGSWVNTEPLTIVDLSGVIAPSGTQFFKVESFDSVGSYEYQVSGTSIIFSGDHDALDLWYETSTQGFYQASGWDFNPVHTALSPGFIWISNQQQTINPSGNYSFYVSPNELFFGEGGSAVGIGTLVDQVGQPIAGAETTFVLEGPGTLSTTNGLTGLDGQSFTLYNPANNFAGAISSGLYVSGNILSTGNLPIYNITNTLIVSGDITATPNQIYTIQITQEPSYFTPPSNIGPYFDYSITTTQAVLTTDTAYSLTINPNDWNLGPYSSGWNINVSGTSYSFLARYIIGGSGSIPVGTWNPASDLYNIDLSSLINNSSAIPPINLSGMLPSNIYYDSDNYFNPLPFGRVGLYTNNGTIISGTTTVNFNTFAPIVPIAISGNTPSAGLSTIIYASSLPAAIGYEIASPTTATITSTATWNGITTTPISGVITLNFAPQQTDVFGLDNKAVDFVSYLRYIGI